jgi:uncharacterized protein YeaO (DUF488 family)
VRLGSPRVKGEGLRLGTVRRPPRGVKKADTARRDYYDLWLPDLAPSAKLVSRAARDFEGFAKAYRREMTTPGAERLLELLSRLSHQADFSVGCYCEDEARCHRSILRQLLAEHGARF